MHRETRKGLDFEGQCLLIRSCILSQDKHTDFNFVVGLIEDYEFPINYPLNRNGETALMIAAGQCKLNIINFLLHHSGDPNLRDINGNTAVIHCLRGMKSAALEALRMLHSNGAVLVYRNYFKQTPHDFIDKYREKDNDEYEDLIEAYDELTSTYYYKVLLYYSYKRSKIHLI